MKRNLLILKRFGFLTLCFWLLPLSEAANACMVSKGGLQCVNGEPIPEEISAMLTSPEYSKTMAGLINDAKNRGAEIKISEFSLLSIPPKTFAYIYLLHKPTQAGPTLWKALGSLCSEIIYGPLPSRGIRLNGLWYSPVAEPPGGATVGN